MPPVVLLYLIGMLGCTFKLWDTAATKDAYNALRNPILYAMIFVMLLRCDIRQILKLGPKMLLGFFTATITIAIGFVVTYALMHPLLGEGAWRGLGALCGSWMGGSGNLVAVADALQATEAQLAGASIVDSIDYSIWVMFLLWAITLAPKFNKWVKANTKTLDEVSSRLDAEFAQAKTKKVDFPSLIFLLGLALAVSAVCTNLGTALRNASPKWLQVFDVATFRIVLVSIIGLVLAMTPIGKIAGSTELSNVMLYMVIGLIASRASFLELFEAGMAWWIVAGFAILLIHGVLMILAAKLFKLDMFTSGVASLANIGGTASAPILAECIPATATEPGIFRWDDMDYIKRRIDEVKAKCRWCVIVSHGGEEFTSMPSPYTRDRYLRYLELGADVVVAHHPHVPENYELFPDGKAIFYSLGNFIFDTNYQRAHLYTDVGVLLKLIFTPEKLDFEAMGIQIVRGPEKIVEAPLPDIFTNIPVGEYALLSPLAAKAFVAEDMRKMVYLEPDRFTNAPQEVWDGYFFSTEPDGYFEGAHMDFHVIVPFSKIAEEGAWKYSKLDKVKEYILKQL